jgi:hypothetical protein
MKKLTLILALVAGCAGVQHTTSYIDILNNDTTPAVVATEVGFDWGQALAHFIARH